MSRVFYIAAVVVAFGGYVVFISGSPGAPWLAIGVIAVVATAQGTIGKQLDKAKASRRQVTRDLNASEVLESLRRNVSPSDYFLYLRPFFITGKLQHRNPAGFRRMSPALPGYFSEPDTVELEDVLTISGP